ncbi:hypothetical protein [Methyloterricola oryzae]|uniref:hypothetical protein n=1 Tax=Methyloterricola oryzae TaxID=1495050 RepID=UPI0005EB0A36|nr:hypothetical protein [Methyloterricola oryzae]
MIQITWVEVLLTAWLTATLAFSISFCLLLARKQAAIRRSRTVLNAERKRPSRGSSGSMSVGHPQIF